LGFKKAQFVNRFVAFCPYTPHSHNLILHPGTSPKTHRRGERLCISDFWHSKIFFNPPKNGGRHPTKQEPPVGNRSMIFTRKKPLGGGICPHRYDCSRGPCSEFQRRLSPLGRTPIGSAPAHKLKRQKKNRNGVFRAPLAKRWLGGSWAAFPQQVSDSDYHAGQVVLWIARVASSKMPTVSAAHPATGPMRPGTRPWRRKRSRKRYGLSPLHPFWTCNLAPFHLPPPGKINKNADNQNIDCMGPESVGTLPQPSTVPLSLYPSVR